MIKQMAIIALATGATFFSVLSANSNPVEVLEFVLNDRGIYTEVQKSTTKNAIAKVVQNNGVSVASKARWLPFAMKYLGKGGLYGSLAMGAYDLFTMYSDDGYDTVTTAKTDYQIAGLEVAFTPSDFYTDPKDGNFAPVTGWQGKYNIAQIGELHPLLKSEVYKHIHDDMQNNIWSQTWDRPVGDVRPLNAEANCFFYANGKYNSVYEMAQPNADILGLDRNGDMRRMRVGTLNCEISYNAYITFTHSIIGTVVGAELKYRKINDAYIRPINGSAIQTAKPTCQETVAGKDVLCAMDKVDKNPQLVPLTLNLDGSITINGWTSNDNFRGVQPRYFTDYNHGNQDLLKDLLNKLLHDANALTGDQGIPINQPITSDEVSSVINNYYYTDYHYGDTNTYIRSDSGKGTFPWAPVQPDDWTPPKPTDPDPKPTDPDPKPTDPDPKPNDGIDLTHPDKKEPELPEIPTIQMIMDPVLNVFPMLKQWSFPNVDGECPKPDFDAFGKVFVVEAHCYIAEQNRSIIGASFMIFYALMSVLIVLRA